MVQLCHQSYIRSYTTEFYATFNDKTSQSMVAGVEEGIEAGGP